VRALYDWIASHPALSGALVAASLATFVGSLLALPWLVARLPADYFVGRASRRGAWRDQHPVLVLVLVVLKNALGLVLLLAGLAMLVLPGQGILTLLAALVLLDLPGKRALERRVVAWPRVLAALNWLRRRAGREPLLPPAD